MREWMVAQIGSHFSPPPIAQSSELRGQRSELSALREAPQPLAVRVVVQLPLQHR